jgi:hypothetical protein
MKLFLTITLSSFCLLAQAQIPTNGLNAYWPFDSNANDYSGNNNNGTVMNAVPTTDRFGNPNRAYAFDGTSSKIDVPSSSTIDMANTQDFTIAFWMKSDANNVDAVTLSKHVYGSWNGYVFNVSTTNIGYCNTPGHGSFYVAAGAKGDACSNNPITNDTNNWYFITGIYNASSNTTSLYVNSTLQSSLGSKSGSISNTRPLTFGAFSDPIHGGYYYKGKLDGIRIYNRVLTQAEINALYNEPNPAAVGLNDLITTNNLFKVSPNPSSSLIHLTWSDGVKISPTSQGTLQIYSMEGKLVHTQQLDLQDLNSTKIDVSQLSPGVYHINLTIEQYTQNIKLIKD